MANERVRILLAHEEPLFRDLIRAILSEEADLEVVGEATTGPEALLEVERLQPSVVLMSAHLPEGDGIRICRQIKEGESDSRVIVVNDGEGKRTAIEALEAGANAYLTRASTADDLLAAVRSQDVSLFVPKEMQAGLVMQLVERLRQQEDTIQQISRLTAREQEILAFLVEGASTRMIAECLSISPQTARTHIQNLLGKLGVHSRLQAVALVRKNRRFEELLKRRAPVERWLEHWS